jgi:hypothetical protein
MSLLYGANFEKSSNALIIPNDSCFRCLFYDDTTMEGCNITSAPELPATTLKPYCYQYMFYDCKYIVTAPKLPATTLAECCYWYMFSHTNILPDTSNIDFTSAQVVASGGLRGLFARTKITDNDLMLILPKNHENKYCLPATILTSYCYHEMFYECTSLTTSPELPATTLAEHCYSGMFSGCSSLTSAPELPATTLVQYCYYCMFRDCTSLTTAPELLAITLVDNCYSQMFSGCSKLNYIKAMFTTTPSGVYTNNWLEGVASSGTFVKNTAATWDVINRDGVPSGWTIEYRQYGQ